MAMSKRDLKAKIETAVLPVGSRMLALEPRFVFDAAIATEIQHLADQTDGVGQVPYVAEGTGDALFAAASHLADAQEAVSTFVDSHNIGVTGREIAFIDDRLADLGLLVSAVPDSTRIVLIDGARDGVQQMVDALQSEHDVTGIHILSHGSAGNIQLGTSAINADTMSTVHRSALEAIGGSLSVDADILVYGCNFAAGTDGQMAAAILANLTGADVAASEDLTGADVQGGDWLLEDTTGAIESSAIAAADYSKTLSFVNQAPSGVDKTITTTVSTAVTLQPTDFGFSDVDGNEFRAVKITTLTTAGTLYMSGAPVAAGQLVSIADIVTGQLVWCRHRCHWQLRIHVPGSGWRRHGRVYRSVRRNFWTGNREVHFCKCRPDWYDDIHTALECNYSSGRWQLRRYRRYR